MSLNTHPQASQPILLQSERLLTPGYTADLELRVPATIDGPRRTETARGRVWVTDHRIVFLAETALSSSYDAPPTLTSLIIPYSCLRSNTFNLPLFGANNLSLAFVPDRSPGSEPHLPEPGRGGAIEAKLIVGEGAGHGVWKRVEGEREAWAARKREAEQLPAYTPN
ncbi:hypothetical protein Q5752_002348 [Cryptotrichosporon argae]